MKNTKYDIYMFGLKRPIAHTMHNYTALRLSVHGHIVIRDKKK